MNYRLLAASLLLASLSAPSHALDPDERALFGLTALENSHPHINGEGYSVGVSDTEFDVTHPGLGWTGGAAYNEWFYNRQPIPQLNRINPRIYMSGHNAQTEFGEAMYHGVLQSLFRLPITFNNTLMTNWWGFHGTAVSGTAAGGLPGPEGMSLGAAPRARLVLAGNTADFPHLLSMVPDGNPSRTVAMNRSFTGSSYVDSTMRANSGVIGVNAAGNYFNALTGGRMNVFGMSPDLASIRWSTRVGYDLIASGLTVDNATEAYPNWGGSQRNQESIFTDYIVRTIAPGGYFDGGAGGTSFASPLLAGGVTLVQQAYESTHPGRWLRVDQMNRILRKSARFVDDLYTGLRYPVANFHAAVQLAETYVGDPSTEPNFTADFAQEARIGNRSIQAAPYYLTPLYFRTASYYGTNSESEFTAPVLENGFMNVKSNAALGAVNVVLRNGWGDLAVADLSDANRKLSIAFNYDTFAGSQSANQTVLYVGFKEMVGSDQFMDSSRTHDGGEVGRLAFRIMHIRPNGTTRIDLVRCSELPVTTGPVWSRPNYWTAPSWDSTALITAYATNLHNGTLPRIEVEFTSARAKLKVGGTTLIDAVHTTPAILLSRATPYLHFQNNAPSSHQRLSNFSVTTASIGQPQVALENTVGRAIEGVNGPAANGIFTIRRTSSTASPLTVYYHVTGTAANGTDYDLLPGSLILPAGVASADLLIRPRNDTTVEPDENVVVTLTSNGSYGISPYSETGRVTLVDYSDVDGDGIWSWDEDANRNGNVSDDDANANMLPNYLDSTDRVPTNNVAPVAHAGPARTTTGTASVALDGTASYDPDGQIAAFAWTILPAASNGPVVIENAASSTPSVRWTDPTATARTVRIQLTVTDNHGASASATTTVTQLAGQVFSKTYPQVYVRGSANGWGTTAMTLVSNYTWQLDMHFANETGEKFKFDVYGDWSLNFGDNNFDSIGDQGGNNINIHLGAGTYRIVFNDQTKRFSFTKLVVNQPPVANAGPDKTTYQMNSVELDGSASSDPDGTIAAYQWTILEGQSGPVVLTNATSAKATLYWHAPAITTRTALVQLTVTDNAGATAADTVLVTQTTNLVLLKTYPQVHVRGTGNGWGNSLMTLVSNYTWQIDMTFPNASGEKFKFDVYGDWSLNFGDNNFDSIGDQSGNDINVHLGAGTYRIVFNDQTKRFSFNKRVVNQPPVANAGPSQTVGLDGATITLDGSASHDPDGSIIEYSWQQASGPTAPITYAHPGNPIATAVILSRTNEATYVFRLRVTDNEGAMSTSSVTVIQKAAGFEKTYPQVHFRGAPNGWGTTLMTLVSNHVWETEAAFGGNAGESFKFDVYGDWSVNFGDNNADGVAEQGGGNIGIATGAGTYRIRFNDQSRAYWIAKIGGSFIKDYNTVGVAGSFNNWNPAANNLTLIDDNTWSGTFVLSGNVEFKIAANGSWGVNWGENNQPGTSVPLTGYLENSGGNIRLSNLAGATYRITMNERTRAYSVTLIAGSEAGTGRHLVGWESLYNLDLLAGVTAGLDPDADGLSNLDEYHLGTSPFAADTDRDGMNDPHELVAATDPLDTASHLAAAPSLSGQGPAITWNVQANRAYRIEASDTLDGAWTAVTEWMIPAAGTESFSAPAASGYLFYRVVVGEPGVVGTTDR